eukprot:CAMPEP_0170217102 /NCGR_PEP_ID=MMETSP0116_2-20130129/8213_1 /TAXON_ID=400756 /ORGANISM="Durinskia baltica, Strain CSIRO CS-38" /LENGTH=118 /DNA_ID=CAMNT_0010467729 /DNA_START=495 /DNA_END=847 /DNA_ORIENTATION=+
MELSLGSDLWATSLEDGFALAPEGGFADPALLRASCPAIAPALAAADCGFGPLDGNPGNAKSAKPSNCFCSALGCGFSGEGSRGDALALARICTDQFLPSAGSAAVVREPPSEGNAAA